MKASRSASEIERHVAAQTLIAFQLRRGQIEAAILAVLIAVMSVAWLAPWIHYAERLNLPEIEVARLSPIVMLLLVLLGALITRRAIRTSERRRRVLGLVLLSGFAMLPITAWLTFGARFPAGYVHGLFEWQGFLSAETVVLIATAVLWLRGALIGRADVLREDLESMFYTGIFGSALLLLVNATRPMLSINDLFWSALVFFIASLTALALVGPEHAHFWQRETTSVRLVLNRYWLTAVVAVVGLIVIISLIAAGSTDPSTSNRVKDVVVGLITLIALGLQLIMSIVVQLIVWLITPLIPLLEKFAPLFDSLLNVIRAPASGMQTSNVPAAEAVFNSPQIATFMHGLAVLIILLLLAVAFWLTLLRVGFLPNRHKDEERESILTRDLVLSQLRQLFARRARSVGEPPLYLTLNGAAGDTRLLIRRIYRSMLDWARLRGRSRFPYQTPLMYADMLVADMPQIRSAIADLTQAYLLARYSIDPLPPDEARRAQTALDQVLASYTAPTAT